MGEFFILSNYINVAIRNGIVRRWTTGVYGSFVRNGQYERLLLSHNTSGLRAGEGALVTDCTAESNSQTGIDAGSGSRIHNCIARRNGANGISAGSSSIVTGCTVVLNGADGISIDRGTVKDCVARQNTGDGIDAFIHCSIVGNTCLDNGFNGDGAGINSTQGANRIEGNLVGSNDRGIDCNPSTGNLIIRNSANVNGNNYDVVANNTIGPIVTSATIGTNANPHANYVH